MHRRPTSLSLRFTAVAPDPEPRARSLRAPSPARRHATLRCKSTHRTSGTLSFLKRFQLSMDIGVAPSWDAKGVKREKVEGDPEASEPAKPSRAARNTARKARASARSRARTTSEAPSSGKDEDDDGAEEGADQDAAEEGGTQQRRQKRRRDDDWGDEENEEEGAAGGSADDDEDMADGCALSPTPPYPTLPTPISSCQRFPLRIGAPRAAAHSRTRRAPPTGAAPAALPFAALTTRTGHPLVAPLRCSQGGRRCP